MTGAVRPPGQGGAGRREREPGARGLLALLASGVLLALALRAWGGAPRLPEWAELRRGLGGSELADADLVTAATALCWLVLCYLALAVSLRLLVLAAARASGGAAWARAALRVSNLVTVPAVRRLVDSGIGGALLAASWLPLPAPGTAPPPPAAWVAAAPVAAEAAEAAADAARARHHASYTVAPGEHPWGIARLCYGDGTRVIDLFRANCGRAAAGAGGWIDPRQIAPGTVLAVPLPTRDLSARDGLLTYRVRPGDHLWGIAERWLGDGFRWVEIWELNRGAETEEGLRFTDPNLLHPGLLLTLPWDAVQTLPAPEPDPAPAGSGGAAGALPATALTEAGPAGGARAENGSGPAPVGRLGDPPGGSPAEWLHAARPIALSAGGLAVVGGAVLFVRRLHGAGSLRLPGLAARRGEEPGDAGLVALVAGALEATLAECGFPGTAPLLVREGARRLEVTVACPAGDAGALPALRPELERRLACDVGAAEAGPAHVVLTLSWRGPPAPPAILAPDARPALVVPAGAEGDDIVYLNLAAAGGVTVSGDDAERGRLLRSWLATLSVMRSPGDLVFRADAGAARLLGADAGLPHFAGGAAGGSAAELAAELDEVIVSRGQAGGPARPLVAIVDLDAGERDLPLAAMRHGPACGVHVIQSLPAAGASEGAPAAGASLALGTAAPDGAGDGEAPPGAITLRIGRFPPLRLDPVRVRRDASARWSEGAPVAAAAGHAASEPGEPLARRTAREGLPVGGRPPAVDGSCGRAPGGDPVAGTDGGAGVAPEQLPEAGVPDALEPDARGPGPSTIAGNGARDAAPGDDARADPSAPLEPSAGARDVSGPGAGAGPASMAGAPDGPAPAPELRGPAAPPRAGGTTRQGALFTSGDAASPAAGATAGAGPAFTIRCLGPFEVWHGGVRITGWPREKSREILAFLAAHGGAAVPRESVAEALWPGEPWDASLRHVMTNVASSLRTVLRSAAGDDALQPVVGARQRYRLQAHLFRIDLDAFDAALAGPEALAEYERAAALYRGDFLEGELFEWLGGYRSDYGRRLVDAAGRAASIAEELGERERAARLYGVILEREPADEPAARGLMRQRAAAGQPNEARRVFNQLTEALRQELDDPRARPGPETTALLAGLVAGEGNAAR